MVASATAPGERIWRKDRLIFGGAYKGRRVLVTGHTGFKGSWLSHWLLQLGAEVAGYSLYVPSEPSNFEVLKLADRLHDYRRDVRNLEDLQATFDEVKPEIVFHLAAQAIVRAAYDEPKLTFDTNLGGTVNVLEVVRRSPSVKAAVFITSDKCYENVEWQYGYREIDRLGGKDPYSASKACAEIAVSAYGRSFFPAHGGKKIASTRAGNVIGGGDWARDRIIPDCVRAWANGKEAVVRSPRATRPWQHVLEPVGGYLWLGSRLLAKQADVVGEAFNFGPRVEVNQPVSRLIEEMMKVWRGVSWKHQNDGSEQRPEAGLLKLCCDKALQRLGWQATLSFEKTVTMTTEWYRAYYAGTQDMREFTNSQIHTYVQLAQESGLQWAKP